jgi:hypothetical protein
VAENVKKLLRLPPDLLAGLTSWAAEEDRSVNSLIVHLLRRAIADRQSRSQAAQAYAYPDTVEHRATGRLMHAAER